VPRVHRARQRDREERHRPPAKRARLPQGERQREAEGHQERREAESVVAGEDALHDTRGDGSVDYAERGGRDQERQKDLHPEPGAQERGREAVEDPHLELMIWARPRDCQGVAAADRPSARVFRRRRV
jgi:hypothetical protein